MQDRKKRAIPGSAGQLLDAFGDCYTLLSDPHGLILEVNQPLSALLGQERRRLIGQPVASVFAPYEFRTGPLRFRLALEEPRLWRHAWNGRWFEVRTYPIGPDSRERLLAVMIRDITDQVDLETGLKQTRERLDTLTANLPGTIFSLAETSAGLRLIYLSQVRYRSFGFEQADLLENPALLSECLLPEDRQRLIGEASEARRQAKPLDTELRIRTTDGRLVWLQVIASARGQVWDGMVFDITRRKWTEEALHDSEERLSLAMEAASEGIWDLNLTTGALMCTPRCHAMLGYGPHEVEPSGQAWLNLIHPDERRAVLRQLNRHIKGRAERFEAEFRLRTRAGGWIWTLSRGRIMRRDAAGRPLRLMGTNIDINERKLMEARNRQYEERLFQRQKLEAIGTLAGGIAHDFNNILSAIVGFTELLVDETPDDSQIKTHLKEILKASERGRGLVNQILGARSQSSGERHPVQVQLIVLETLKLLAASLPDNITLKRRIDRGIDPVLADATWIHQIIMNLVTNAIHALSPQGGSLSVSLEVADDEQGGRGLRLTVADSGPGIAPEIAEHIFEPFFSTRPDGTGLGLATVKGLVKDLGGWIQLESQPGAGASFMVYLPTMPVTPQSTAARGGRLPRGHGEHVLLVDDELPITEVGCQLLERLGYRVTALNDGTSALKTFRQQHADIDVVITDQAMPNLSGLDLARALNEVKPGIPIILCTGLSDRLPESPLICRHIFKPVAREDLAQTLRQVLKGTSGPKGRSNQI